MRRTGEESNINEFLTSYLKHFKVNFHSQLNIIESLSCPESEEFSEPSMSHKISKLKDSLNALKEQTSLIPTYTRINAKTLQRFCLRINEYIEFRVAKATGVIAQATHHELSAMCVALHRVFVDINKKSRDDEVSESDYQVTQVFNRICEVQSKYMMKIFKMLGATESTKDIADQFIKIKCPKDTSPIPFNHDTCTPHYQSMASRDINSIMLNKFMQSPYYNSKIRPRKSIIQKIQHCTSNSTPLNIFHSNYGSTNSSSHINFNIESTRSPECITGNKQRVNDATDYQSDQNRATICLSKSIGNGLYKWIDDVIEIGNDRSAKYTEESLMKELVENNKYNCTAIQKFRKKTKKIRLKISEPPLKQGQNSNTAIEWSVNHKRSYTLDSSKSKPNTRKDEKFLGLPLLKRKSIKV